MIRSTMKVKTSYWFYYRDQKVIFSKQRPRGRCRPATYEEVKSQQIDEQYEDIKQHKLV